LVLPPTDQLVARTLKAFELLLLPPVHADVPAATSAQRVRRRGDSARGARWVWLCMK
jgi:hypothetical protein